MQLFIKKPIAVEAEQWLGCNISTLSEWMATGKTDFYVTGASKGIIQILTLEGIMTVRIGDWVIKGIDGELYPCKDSIFKKSYGLASEIGDDHEALVEFSKLQIEVANLKLLVKMGERVVNDFLPNIGNCTLQDYTELNDFLGETAKIPDGIAPAECEDCHV